MAGAVLHLKHKRAQVDRSASGDATPPRDRDPTSRSSQVPLALVRQHDDHEHPTSAVTDAHRSVAVRELVVRWERRRGALTVWLSGVLDRITERALDRELAARATGRLRLVIDLTELEFIDYYGLETLVRIHRRATDQGDRLCFRHGQHVAQRPLGLVRAVQLRRQGAPGPERGSDEDSYFALAMACADVDHPPSGDRRGAA
jgi:anti-anti-sigma factor